jgi:uncharacterized Ntn-hydrolase superfamily protein
MTFSIVARSADGQAYGVAVASKFLAVGSAVPAARAGCGALATQSYANLAYRPQGLALLATGVAADGVVAGLTAADPDREHRQLGVVAASGAGASYTGTACMEWAGGRTGDGYAIQGNILAGEQVVAEMERAWLAGAEVAGGEPAGDPAALGDRLLAALRAGDRAGGDRRGRQSAALLVVRPGGGYGGTSDVAVDLRVDDHTDPVPELLRLLELHRLYFGRPDPATLLDLTGPLAEEVAGRLTRLGYAQADLSASLASWAGVENLEERVVSGRIDPLVLERLRAQD